VAYHLNDRLKMMVNQKDVGTITCQDFTKKVGFKKIKTCTLSEHKSEHFVEIQCFPDVIFRNLRRKDLKVGENELTKMW
jgi:hypothetical protein